MAKFKQELSFLLETFSNEELLCLASGLSRTVKGKKTRENLLRTLQLIPGKNSNTNPYITDLFRQINRLLKQDLKEISPEEISTMTLDQVSAGDLRFGRMLMCHTDTIIQGKGKKVYEKALKLCFESYNGEGKLSEEQHSSTKNAAEATRSGERKAGIAEAPLQPAVDKQDKETRIAEILDQLNDVDLTSLDGMDEMDKEIDGGNLIKALENRLNELEIRLTEQSSQIALQNNQLKEYKEELRQKERSINELEAELKRQKNKYQKEVEQTNKYKKDAEGAKDKLKDKVLEAQKQKEQAGYWRNRAEGSERRNEEQEKKIAKLHEELLQEKEKSISQASDIGLTSKIARALEKARAEAVHSEKQAAASRREPDNQRSGAAMGSGRPKELYFGDDRGYTVLVFADQNTALDVEFAHREIKVLWAGPMDYKRPCQRLQQVQMVLYDESHPMINVDVIRQAAEGQSKRCYELKSYLE